MSERFRTRVAGLLVAGLATAAEARLEVPSFFSDNMVLQRDVPVPLWGWAEDGEPVSIIYGDHQLKKLPEIQP